MTAVPEKQAKPPVANPASQTQRHVEAGGASPPTPSLSALAAWLIPSAAALFALAGYVVQFSQDELLGLESKDFNPNLYIGDAADFLRDIAVSLLANVSTMEFHLGPYWPIPILLAIPTLSAVLASAIPKLRARKALAYAHWIILACLVLKFVAFDAPVLRLKDLIAGPDHVLSLAEISASPPSDEGKSGQVATPRAKPDPNKVQPKSSTTSVRGVLPDLIERRALQLTGEIICSRVNDDTIKAHQLLYVNPGCAAPPAAAKQRGNGAEATADNPRSVRAAGNLAGEFDCILVLTLELAVLSLVSLRFTPRWSHALILLAVGVDALFLPMAYGKLKKSTYFEYGTIKLAHELSPEDKIVNLKGTSTNGLILENGTGGIRILVVIQGECNSISGVGKYDAVRLGSLPQQEVQAIGEIEPKDVINWIVTSTVDECGGAG